MTVTLVNQADAARDQTELDSRLVTFLKPDSFEADQYRMLRLAIERACPSETSRVIAITSSIPGEGKTLTTINLSGAIANSSQARVLMIDADLRRPSIAKMFGRGDAHRGWGLVDAILDRRLSLEQIAWRREPFNVSVVTSRRPQADTYELLANGRFGELVREARQRFEYVIIDTPPVLPTADSRLLAEWIDGYVILISGDSTPRKLLEETLALLGPAKILGLVFNRESYKHSRYGKYYYRAYTSRDSL
ncbi:MAG TPA: CpsD/CapB family tyrosine-protein kinase [Thermoanaerobaculia bacterium]|nr:CpsD/CapB family tyrosine-protein kinase [Thermoanaerobaculia bacterium]